MYFLIRTAAAVILCLFVYPLQGSPLRSVWVRFRPETLLTVRVRQQQTREYHYLVGRLRNGRRAAFRLGVGDEEGATTYLVTFDDTPIRSESDISRLARSAWYRIFVRRDAPQMLSASKGAQGCVARHLRRLGVQTVIQTDPALGRESSNFIQIRRPPRIALGEIMRPRD